MYVSPDSGGTVKVEETTPLSYPSTSNFTSGATVRLEAIPTSTTRFSNWSGDLSGNTNPATVVMTCNKKITANFTRIEHTLTVQVNGEGTTDPEKGSHSYFMGTIIGISAKAADGWRFDSWTGNVTEPYLFNTTVTMDSDKTVTANFSQNSTSWPYIGGAIAGVIIIGMTTWRALRRRKSNTS